MSYSAPLLLLILAALVEAAHRFARRRQAPWAEASAIAAAFARPWMVWAVLNLVFRWHDEEAFNNPHTFPFYANLWHPKASGIEALAMAMASPEFWGWSAAALALTGALWALARATVLKDGRPIRAGAAVAALTVLAFALPLAMACVPEGAAASLKTESSLLAAWLETGGTMVNAVPRVKTTRNFLENFEEIQPTMKYSIHGASHPPGAALSLFWLGRLVGAEEKPVLDALRYALVLCGFSALSVPLMFLLGRDVGGDARTGLLAAFLWAVKPAALAHNTFAQDGVYTVFFLLSLWLSWRLVTDARYAAVRSFALGAALFAAAMLTFSWVVLVALHGLFALWHGHLAGRPVADTVRRALMPLLTAAILITAACVAYDLNYFTAYFQANAFVLTFYQFDSIYAWTMALLGGQVEWLIMMGAVVCSLFIGEVLPSWWRQRASPRALLGLLLLGLYVLPVLFGPNPLKMETARCWSWVAALPMAAVARHLADGASPRGAWIQAAILLSVAQYYLMRIWICYLS